MLFGVRLVIAEKPTDMRNALGSWLVSCYECEFGLVQIGLALVWLSQWWWHEYS